MSNLAYFAHQESLLNLMVTAPVSAASVHECGFRHSREFGVTTRQDARFLCRSCVCLYIYIYPSLYVCVYMYVCNVCM